ncbi:hypothetical protein DFQ26_006335 [Actinomortierella ambigua]|nr:hypothetical protein DFQ26_006335 [Actinomortierella ambigua]
MASIFDIGEIVHGIATRLDTHDLARCLRVSRRYHVAFAPYLYSKFSTLSAAYLSRGCLPAALFARYGKLVQVLTVAHPIDLQAIADHTTNLKHLQLSLRGYQGYVYETFPDDEYLQHMSLARNLNWGAICESVGTLLDANTRLQSLMLDTCGEGKQDLPDFKKLLLQPSRLAFLARLTLCHFCYGTRTILDLLAHFERLREIIIQFDGHPLIDHQPEQFLPCYQLERINIGHVAADPGLVLFNTTLWEHSPRLASLEIASVTAKEIAKIAQRVFEGPMTDSVDLSIKWLLDKKLPTRTIRSFRMQPCDVGQNTLGVFLTPERSPHLKILSLDRCSIRIPSRLIQDLLTSCPALEEFIVGASTLDIATTTTISALDIVGHGPWVCHGLKVLKIPIVGLCHCRAPPSPRSDEDARPHPPLQDHSKCRSLERAVYHQLAQLRRLRTLHVGRDVKLTWARRNGPAHLLQGTLSFSLANGLDELGPLFDLEKVDATDLSLAVGLPEAQWMARHWPRWHYMGGLDPRSEGGTWLKENKPGFLFF